MAGVNYLVPGTLHNPPIEYEISLDEKYRLGVGAFASVYKFERDGKTFACKVINKDKANDPSTQRFLERERQMVGRLNHPNVVNVFDYGFIGCQLVMFMEYCEGGELKKWLASRRSLDADTVRHLFTQMIQGVQYLHTQRIIHRDLKPENFLVATVYGRTHVKLNDFGLAREYEEETEMTNAKTTVGSKPYMAPEVLTRHYGPPVDVWSLGCILFELVEDRRLIGTVEDWEAFCRARAIPDLDRKISEKTRSKPYCLDLLLRMLDPVKETRITLPEALQNKFITEQFHILEYVVFNTEVGSEEVRRIDLPNEGSGPALFQNVVNGVGGRPFDFPRLCLFKEDGSRVDRQKSLAALGSHRTIYYYSGASTQPFQDDPFALVDSATKQASNQVVQQIVEKHYTAHTKQLQALRLGLEYLSRTLAICSGELKLSLTDSSAGDSSALNLDSIAIPGNSAEIKEILGRLIADSSAAARVMSSPILDIADLFCAATETKERMLKVTAMFKALRGKVNALSREVPQLDIALAEDSSKLADLKKAMANTSRRDPVTVEYCKSMARHLVTDLKAKLHKALAKVAKFSSQFDQIDALLAGMREKQSLVKKQLDILRALDSTLSKKPSASAKLAESTKKIEELQATLDAERQAKASLEAAVAKASVDHQQALDQFKATLSAANEAKETAEKATKVALEENERLEAEAKAAHEARTQLLAQLAEAQKSSSTPLESQSHAAIEQYRVKLEEAEANQKRQQETLFLAFQRRRDELAQLKATKDALEIQTRELRELLEEARKAPAVAPDNAEVAELRAAIKQLEVKHVKEVDTLKRTFQMKGDVEKNKIEQLEEDKAELLAQLKLAYQTKNV